MKLKLDAVELFVGDLAKAVHFYRDVLGMETVWDGKAPNVELFSNGFMVTLYGREDLEAEIGVSFTYPSGTNGTMALGFDIEDYTAIDSEYERMVNMGAISVMPPTDSEKWNERVFLITDPDGNLIEVGAVEATKRC